MSTLKFRNITGPAKGPSAGVRRLFLGGALGVTLGVFGLAGCHSNPADSTAATVDPNAPDPAAANMAPVDNSTPASSQGTTKVAGYQQAAQPSQQSYSNPAPAPIERRAPSAPGSPSYSSQNDTGYNQGYNDNQDYNAEQGYNATLSDIEAPQPPPPLPEYAQPPAPDPNYIWTPGYWNYAPTGYYWVPGAWVEAPYTGALWTPGYWGGYGTGYRFHHGFWAAHIGFYGGINYGFGYVGVGYQGGYWNGPRFYYNQYASNIDIAIHPGFREAVYQHNVVVNNTVINNRIVNNTTYNNVTVNNTRINNVSYNGGRGGVEVKPRPAELAVLREQRVPPMQAQVQVAKAAAANPQQFYARNQGRPVEVAAARPLAADRGIVPPPRTTAQINRAAPAPVEQRQQQESFHPQPQLARPAATPAPLPNRAVPAQERTGTVNQTVRPVQTEARPQPEARRQPEPQHPQPQHEIKPQPPARTESVRPQPHQTRPEPQPRPQAQTHTQETRPQPQARPQPEARPKPEAHPQPLPQQEHAKPEPHAQVNPSAHPSARREEHHGSR